VRSSINARIRTGSSSLFMDKKRSALRAMTQISSNGTLPKALRSRTIYLKKCSPIPEDAPVIIAIFIRFPFFAALHRNLEGASTKAYMLL